MRRLALVVCAAALVSCNAVAAKAPWPALHPAEVQRRIVQQMKTDTLITINPLDVSGDQRLGRALVTANILDAAGSNAHFTAYARSNSQQCSPDGRSGDRCFNLVRRELVRILLTKRTPQTIEGGGNDLTIFSFRAIPVGPVAKKLAAAAVLLCQVAPKKDVIWNGAETIAQGVFQNYNATSGSSKLDFIDESCPRTKRSQRGSNTLDDVSTLTE